MKKKSEFTEQKAHIAHLIDGNRQAEPGKEPSADELDLLAKRLRNGDRTAATELIDIYYVRMYLFFRRLGHNQQASEDLTQESFLQAWQHIGQLRSAKAFNGWLYRVAGYVSRFYWRRHKHWEQPYTENPQAVAGKEDGSGRVEYAEQLVRVKYAVTQLPIKLREAIVLHYMQQLTIAEAAEAAGIREGTFKSRLSRALKVLREQLP